MKNKIAFIVMSVMTLSLNAQIAEENHCTYYGTDKYPDKIVEKCYPIIDKGDVDLCNVSGYSPYDYTDYFGRTGGLYPDYKNFPPAAYAAEFPDLSGEDPIVMVGVGPSIPESIIARLQTLMPECQLDDVVLINAGLPGKDLYDANFRAVKFYLLFDKEPEDDAIWVTIDSDYESNFDDNGNDIEEPGEDDPERDFNIYDNTGVPYWHCVQFLIYKAGYSPSDVDVLWAMQGLIGDDENETGYGLEIKPIEIDILGDGSKSFNTTWYNSTYFESYMTDFNEAYHDFLDNSRSVGGLSNLEVIYLSDAPYEGYAFSDDKYELLPPYDYWNGWGVKQLVEEYIDDDFWPVGGGPYVAWGPYFWRRGYKESYFDGFETDYKYYCEDYLEEDGFHLSSSGKAKAAAYAKFYFRQTDWYYPQDCQALNIDCPERLSQSASDLNVLCTQSGDALEIFVLNGSSTDTYQFALYNLMGQQVFEQNGGTEAIVSGLPAGQYFYVVTNNNLAQLATGAAVYVK